MSIPAEAVEAAAEAFAQAPLAPYDPPTDAAQTNLNNRAQMTLALEAAAPHILAKAWDEIMTRAAEIAWEHDVSASSSISSTPNPYRIQS